MDFFEVVTCPPPNKNRGSQFGESNEPPEMMIATETLCSEKTSKGNPTGARLL